MFSCKQFWSRSPRIDNLWRGSMRCFGPKRQVIQSLRCHPSERYESGWCAARFGEMLRTRFIFLKHKNNQISQFLSSLYIKTSFFYRGAMRCEHIESHKFDPWNIYKFSAEKSHPVETCRGTCEPPIASRVIKPCVEVRVKIFFFFFADDRFFCEQGVWFASLNRCL